MGRALAQKGMYGFGTGTGPGAPIGSQTLIMMMINNGGGIFAPDGTVDLVTDRNIEAMTFVQELVRSGIVDPASVSYTRDNIFSQWKNKKFAMGIDTAGLDADTGDTTGDLLVMSPLTGPHGDTSSLYFVNNIMMYTNTPSQEGSEAFLAYFIKNMKTLWQQNVMPGLPVLKSIVALPEFQQQTQKVKVIAGVPAGGEKQCRPVHPVDRQAGPDRRRGSAHPVHPDHVRRPDRPTDRADDAPDRALLDRPVAPIGECDDTRSSIGRSPGRSRRDPDDAAAVRDPPTCC